MRRTYSAISFVAFAGIFSSQLFAQGAKLETSETLFTVMTAINACGYDAELPGSNPLRIAVRRELGQKLEESAQAKSAEESLCTFYHDHQQGSDARTVSAYVSLALYLNPPPELTLKAKEADLPPDASAVLGFLPLVTKFDNEAGLHTLWQQHAAAYESLGGQYRDALSRMIQDTELYLRLPSANYMGRNFTVFLEPMGAPSEINARSYGMDYYVVVAPAPGSDMKMALIRHAYLHFLVDPMVGQQASRLKGFDPLMDAVRLAPMDESFKEDPSLLVTECLIRAIEARTLSGGKAPQADQDNAIADSEQQGFVLTRYFYQRLVQFEKDDVGLRAALPAMLNGIDVRAEQRRVSQIQFASSAEPELFHIAQAKESKLLVTAEQRLSAGDVATAEKLARQALAEKTEDPGRALFILAQISLRGKIDEASNYFEQALQSTTEPKVVAWSHIYLGRILDLEDDEEGGAKRAAAIEHYKAAVSASESLPEAKAAAEQGIQKPYSPPNAAQNQQNQPDQDQTEQK